jgi:hypothetical protein
VIVQTYNQHVRLLFSEPGAIAIAKFTQVEGADIVMKSTGSIGSSTGLVPRNGLLVINAQIVGNPETIPSGLLSL